MQRRGFVLSALAAALTTTCPSIAKALPQLPTVDPIYFEPVHEWLRKENVIGALDSNKHTVSYWIRVALEVPGQVSRTVSIPRDNKWHHVVISSESTSIDGIRVQDPKIDLQLRARTRTSAFLDDLCVVKRGKNLA